MNNRPSPSWRTRSTPQQNLKLQKKLGRNIRRLREQGGLTTAQLAQRCRMKLGKLERIEAGAVNLQLSSIVRIARTLKAPASAILEGAL